MPKSTQHLMNFAPLNCVPLSVRTLLDTSNLYIMLCRNLTAASWVIFTASMAFHPLGERVNSDKQISDPTWCPRQDAHDINSPDCKRPEDIDRPKRIGMLRHLLLKELAISAFLYNFHCVILHCGPICLNAFPMIERHDECDPHAPLCMSSSSSMPSFLEMYFIIIPLAPY
jgi:hypothetical protein